MANTIVVPFFAVKLHLSTGGVFMTPLLDSKSVFLNQAIFQLAGKYANKFQQQVLNTGDYHRIVEAYPGGDYYKAEVEIPFKASKHKHYPDFKLSFEYYYRDSDNGVWAVVPSLGLECYAAETYQLDRQLIDVIRMDFTRRQRLEVVQNIVATMWYEALELQAHDVHYRFYTPAELEQLSEGTQQKLLPKVSRKLTIDKREVYGLRAEMDLLARAVKGKFNKSVLLVGPSGVGKTAMVWELVRQRNKRRIKADFWETTASTLIKELTGQTGWQDNLAFLCKELAEQSDFLFVRNFMELFEVGQYEGNSVSMAEFLRPYISRGELNLISECTEEELARIDLRSPNLTAFFQIIKLQEPKEDLEEIIINKVMDLAKLRKKNLSLEAIKETVRLNKRFTPYAGFPGKPIRFLESILVNQKAAEKHIVDRKEVIQYFCEETGMPSFLVDPEIPMDLKKIKIDFNDQLFGQDQAVEKVVNLIGAVKTALTRKGKPIASFLFVGPTGVGKTEMAKILAQFTFGNRDKMIRFDMSEYSNAYAVSRLTGTSYHSDGLLTSAIRREPFCVLLFDEIEKAHPSFYDLLLQILGEGRLTDSKGQLVNFCSTIIIMTSNIGASNIMNHNISWKKAVEISGMSEQFLTAVQKHFRPEMFNRIDQVIPFEPLGQDTIRFVIDREIALLKKREGIQFRNMDFYVEDAVLDQLAVIGFNTKYGARELQRTIREEIIIPLSKELNVQDYDDQLVVHFKLVNNNITLGIEADPLGLELLLEELEKINLADQSSEFRRSIYNLFDSDGYLNMASELDMMMREKNRRGEQFFKNKIKAEKYTTSLHIKDKFDKLKNEIEAHEIELGLQTMEIKAYKPSYSDVLKKWQEKFTDTKKDLVAHLYPTENKCYLYIYGKQLKPIFQFYTKLAKQKDFSLSANSIWYRKSTKMEEEEKQAFIKNEEAKLEMPFNVEKEDDVLVGVELILEAPCVYLYLKNETGHQQWKLSEYFQEIYIVMAYFDEMETKKFIMRKEAYRNPQPRRIIEANHFKDNELKINKEIPLKNQLSVVIDQLDKGFKIKLNQALY